MFGNMIGKGYTVKSAQFEMSMVAEGYYATKSAFKIKEDKGPNTPIIDAVYNVLYSNKEPKKEYSRPTKYSAEASHSLTSSLFDPAIVGTMFT